MSTIQYVGEHQWISNVLHAFIIIGFLASINATLAYFKSSKSEDLTWQRYGRWSFRAQGIMVWLIMGLMFYAMINHYYDLEYVRHHISDDLSPKYVFAAFWEGQEGSFLLWMFWNVLLGLILIKTSKHFESPILSLLSLLQVFLFSMILGIHFGWGEHVLKVGSSPALLVRETFSAPIFQNPDYVKLIKGNGLNPLLQNYWMTIHPPTLFLGFASTIVPFLYAFAGWWKKEDKSWLKPAQEWALFSGFILGLGILMGGAWAYEALSFGGYWAWDPVENMSLVPWIMIIAGLHTNMIARATGRAIGTTYLYYMMAFVLMLYSSYLTRSGVLGNTSVHAFTDMDMQGQLMLMVCTFVGLGLFNYFKNKKSIHQPTEEEKINSREYWMFIGSMILLFSSVLITGSTSLPVFNKIVKLFNPSYAGQVIVDPLSHHNRFQLWIAVLVAFLSGMAELLRFKEIHWNEYKSRFIRLMAASLGLSALTFIVFFKSLHEPSWQHYILQFAGIFAILSNITYLFTFLRGNLKLAGSALAHLGFGIMVLGILATGLNKQIISTNLFAQSDLIEGFKTEDYMKNLVLLRGAPMSIKNFEVTYNGDSLIDPFHRKFDIRFDQKDETGKLVKSFNSSPTLVYSRNESQVPSSNPSIHRSISKDLYTFINWLPPNMMNSEAAGKAEDNLKYQSHSVRVGDTIFYSSGYGVVRQISNTTTLKDYEHSPGDLLLSVLIDFHQLNDTMAYSCQTAIVSRGDLYFTLPSLVNEPGLKVKINPSSLEAFYPSHDQGTDIILKEKQEVTKDGYSIRFDGFDKNVPSNTYASKEGDIAVSTKLTITTATGKTYPAAPIFIIRNSQIQTIHDYIFPEHIRLSCIKIDPATESIIVKFFKDDAPALNLELAEKAPRNDLIVIQSILFPGINLFWLGALTMLGGIFLSGFRRWVH
jgi:cytochrome c-type biogenesis protein CcmF